MDASFEITARDDLAMSSRTRWRNELSLTVAVAALAEFVLLRVGLRMGVLLGDLPGLAAATNVAALMGSAAMNVAVFAAGALTVLVLLDGALVRGTAMIAVVTGLLWHAALALVALTVPTTAPGVGWGPEVLVVSSLAAMSVILGVAASLFRQWSAGVGGHVGGGEGRRIGAEDGTRIAAGVTGRSGIRAGRVLMAIAAAALLALHFSHGAQAVTMLGVPVPGRIQALLLAEALAVLAAIATPFALRAVASSSGVSVTSVAAATVTMLFVGGFLYVDPWLARTISVWTLFFTAYLPPWMYVLASGAWVYAVFTLLRLGVGRKRFTAATGLILLAVGGLKPDYSYFALLGLLGLLLLAESMTFSRS